MKKYIVTILGFLIAPLTAAIMLMGIVGINLGFITSLGFFPVIYTISFGITMIIGLPIYLLLDHFAKVTWWSTLLVGLFCGLMGSLFYRLPNELQLIDFFVVMPVGSLSAFVFWLTWRCGNSKEKNRGQTGE